MLLSASNQSSCYNIVKPYYIFNLHPNKRQHVCVQLVCLSLVKKYTRTHTVLWPELWGHTYGVIEQGPWEQFLLQNQETEAWKIIYRVYKYIHTSVKHVHKFSYWKNYRNLDLLVVENRVEPVFSSCFNLQLIPQQRLCKTVASAWPKTTVLVP